MNCETCKNHGYERDGTHVVLQCLHDDVRGNLCCEACHKWQPLDAFSLVFSARPVELKCAECSSVQPMPSLNDWRCGFPAESPPAWCPGYESAEPDRDETVPQLRLFD